MSSTLIRRLGLVISTLTFLACVLACAGGGGGRSDSTAKGEGRMSEADIKAERDRLVKKYTAAAEEAEAQVKRFRNEMLPEAEADYRKAAREGGPASIKRERDAKALVSTLKSNLAAAERNAAEYRRQVEEATRWEPPPPPVILTTDRKKEIFLKSTRLFRQCEQLAAEKFPQMHDYRSMPPERVKAAVDSGVFKLWAEEKSRIYKRLAADLCAKYGITDDQFNDIGIEGGEKRWPADF